MDFKQLFYTHHHQIGHIPLDPSKARIWNEQGNHPKSIHDVSNLIFILIWPQFSVGYIITENFVGIFKNRFSINELFLIYSFIERFVNYFNEKTVNHEKKLLYFDHLTSLMRVTLINIENYLRYFIVKLKDGYFETG